MDIESRTSSSRSSSIDMVVDRRSMRRGLPLVQPVDGLDMNGAKMQVPATTTKPTRAMHTVHQLTVSPKQPAIERHCRPREQIESLPANKLSRYTRGCGAAQNSDSGLRLRSRARGARGARGGSGLWTRSEGEASVQGTGTMCAPRAPSASPAGGGVAAEKQGGPIFPFRHARHATDARLWSKD
eukprot:scaffold87254_cov72-Phaeocystis_antarctica.AAC.1